MNKLYQNKEWLKQKYSKENLLEMQIAKLCKVHQSTIYTWRKKFSISSRPVGERIHLATGNHCNLSQEAIDWLSGELLGDGNLSSLSPWSAAFFYGSSKEKYINYVSKTLKSFGIRQSGRMHKRVFKIGNYRPYTAFFYESLNYAELLPICKKWYPQGKKIVPRNIKLTPLTCRQWYIGDGSLYPSHSNSNHRQSIQLYTCGFTIPDIEWLKGQLISLGFVVTRQPSYNGIHVSVKSTKDFLNYIGPCPVKCYKYKWNYQSKGGGKDEGDRRKRT